MGMMKKLGSVRCKRAVLAGVLGVGAKGERCVEWAIAIAGKPRSHRICVVPDSERDTNPCGSEACDKVGSVINFVFGHNMLQRCMYADQKETGP